MKRKPHHRNALALVTTLALVVITTILIVGFTVSMRTERVASNAMANSGRSTLLARGALAHATSLLVKNIPSPGAPLVDPPVDAAVNWAVNPGQLTLIDKNGRRTIPLHSGEASSNSDLESVNLNAKSAVTQEYPISSGGEVMRVKWLPVMRDPSQAASATNAIVGRYAFWIDDECAKINFNTASGKPSDIATHVATELSPRVDRTVTTTVMSYILGHPASVNLDSLAVIDPKFYGNIYNRGFYNSPEAFRDSGYVTNADQVYRDNKFFLTAFSRSPEFNVFGKSRIYVMEKPENLYEGGIYQNQADNTQPMYFLDSANIGISTNRAMIMPVVKTIAQYLQRADWPGYPGQSFVKKWQSKVPSTAANPAQTALAEADQVALNMVAMGSLASGYTGSPGDNEDDSVKSLYNMVSLFNGQTGTGSEPDNFVWKGPLSGEPMMPQVPLPLLNEVAMVVTPVKAVQVTGKPPVQPGQYNLRFAIRSELYHQEMGASANGTEGIGLGSMAIRPSYFEYTASSDINGKTIAQAMSSISRTSSKGWRNWPMDDLVALPSGNLLPGGYSVVETEFARYLGTRTDDKFQRITNDSTGTKAIFSGTVKLTFWARMGTAVFTSYFSVQNGKAIQLAPIYTPTAATTDPLYRAADDGGALKYEMTLILAPDGSSAGEPVIQSLEVVDPQVHAHKEDWKALSPGEDTLGGPNTTLTASLDPSKYRYWNMNAPNKLGLGFEDSDFQFSKRYPYRGTSIGMFSFITTGIQRSRPYETLKLQPSTPGEIPDWLVLDLLAPPLLRSNFSINGTSESQSISYLNSTAGKININSKIYPDNAYFTPPPRRAPLDALFAHMPHASDAVDGIMSYQTPAKGFQYAGEVCDAPGVADQGANGFQKEALVRNLADLVTTQSNTFGIWGAAQTVKKKRGNTGYGVVENGDIVTGEKRFFAVVERGVWPGRDDIPGNGHVDDSTGAYDRVAKGKTMPQQVPDWAGVFATIDGPSSPQLPTPDWGSYPPNPSLPTDPIEAADNPLRALMKYRVVYFKFLND